MLRFRLCLLDGVSLKECAPGTPMFASPEVIYHNLFHEESVAVDPTWDLFSFGCMAYFALTGSPFYIDAARILGKTLSKDASMKEVSSITLHARYNPLDVLASAVESEHLTTQDASMLKKILVERVSIDELLRHPFFGVEFSETEFRQLSLDAQHGRNVEQSLRDIRRDMKDMKQSMDEFVAAGSSLPLSNATRVESDAYDAIKKDETLRDYCNVLCRTLNQTYVGCLAAESGQLKRTSHRDSLLSFASHTPLIGKIFEFLNKIVTSVRSISQKNASARFVELATGVADMENSVKRASLLITRAKEHQIHGVEDVCGRLAQFFDSLREKVFYNSINTPAKKMAVKDAMLIIRAAMEGSISVHNDIADQMVDIVVRESDSAFERDDSGDQSPSNGSSTLSSSRGCIIQ